MGGSRLRKHRLRVCTLLCPTASDRSSSAATMWSYRRSEINLRSSPPCQETSTLRTTRSMLYSLVDMSEDQSCSKVGVSETLDRSSGPYVPSLPSPPFKVPYH